LPEELQDAEVRAPVMADEMLRWQGGVNIKVKTKIRFNGQEYSDPNQLPPEVRAAYDQALSSDVANQRIIINGQEVMNRGEMPADVRKLCDDVMSVIENNGEVTLPVAARCEPLITKRQLQLILLVAGALILAFLIVLVGAID
jgi:hypothetical protein